MLLLEIRKQFVDRKRIYYRQWLERFKHTKRKHDTDIGPLSKDRNRMGYKRKDTKRFSLGIGIRSNTPDNTVRIPNRTGQN